MIMKRVLTVALTLLLAAGCKLPSSSSSARRFSPYRAGGIVKPVVAVSDFENLASPPAQWNLGRGMADLLITELLDTEKVTVLERKDLGDVVGEIVLQGKEIFRKEGRVERGRLKNAKYLLRGVMFSPARALVVSALMVTVVVPVAPWLSVTCRVAV